MIHTAWTTIEEEGRITNRIDSAQLDEWLIEIDPGVFVSVPLGCKGRENQERIAYISSDATLHHQLADRSIEFIRGKV